MTLSNARPYITAAEYLEDEKTRETRHEYVRGEIYAMSGASKAHAAIVRNLSFAVHGALRGSGPCAAYTESVKVGVSRADAYYYPDLVVACNERDLADEYVVRHPRLVIEVLSKSTERVDRREKRVAYQQLDSLQEYVLVDSRQRRIECYRRGDGGWTGHLWHEGVVELQSIGLQLSVEELYEGVALPEPGPPDPEDPPGR